MSGNEHIHVLGVPDRKRSSVRTTLYFAVACLVLGVGLVLFYFSGPRFDRSRYEAASRTVDVPHEIELDGGFSYQVEVYATPEGERWGSAAPALPFAEILQDIDTDRERGRGIFLSEESSTAEIAGRTRTLVGHDVLHAPEDRPYGVRARRYQPESDELGELTIVYTAGGAYGRAPERTGFGLAGLGAVLLGVLALCVALIEWVMSMIRRRLRRERTEAA